MGVRMLRLNGLSRGPRHLRPSSTADRVQRSVRRRMFSIPVLDDKALATTARSNPAASIPDITRGVGEICDQVSRLWTVIMPLGLFFRLRFHAPRRIVTTLGKARLAFPAHWLLLLPHNLQAERC